LQVNFNVCGKKNWIKSDSRLGITLSFFLSFIFKYNKVFIVVISFYVPYLNFVFIAIPVCIYYFIYYGFDKFWISSTFENIFLFYLFF
jgi:hypothetical protein